MKVFILSQCKNASTSICDSVKVLTRLKGKDWIGRSAIKEDLSFNWAFIWKYIEKYSVITDDPFPFIYKEIYNRYPDSKYILTYRDPNTWLDSFRFGFEKDWNGLFKIKQALYPFRNIQDNKDQIKEIYNDLNNDILSFFSYRNNFLHFDIDLLYCLDRKEKWELMANFLEVEITETILSKPFPKRRARKI